jgi:hypothetical protein
MSKQEILDFQARWMRPAGIAAILASALLVVAGIVGSVGSASDDAAQLQLYHEHSGRLLLASVISGIGLLLIAFPLYFLFRSARARSHRVRGFAGPLLIIGAVLVCTQGIIFSLGFKDASDRYLAGVGAVEANAQQAPATATTKTTTTTPKAATTTAGTTTTGSTTTTAAKTPAQRAADAKKSFATHEINHASKVKAGRIIGLFGALALIGGAVYTLVWAMRTGLLSRFMSTLGIVFIAALLLIPSLGPIGIVIWFAVLGLMLAGWWVRSLPPAWAAGEAIPWPRPGEPPPGQPRGEPAPGTVEGSGREVSEAPLPEDDAVAEDPGETQGQRRKKRKRRG